MSEKEVQRDPEGPILFTYNNTVRVVCRAPLADGSRCQASFLAERRRVARHFTNVHKADCNNNASQQHRQDVAHHRQQLVALCVKKDQVECALSFPPSPQGRPPNVYGGRPLLGYSCSACGWSLPFDAAALAEHMHQRDHHAGEDVAFTRSTVVNDEGEQVVVVCSGSDCEWTSSQVSTATNTQSAHASRKHGGVDVDFERCYVQRQLHTARNHDPVFVRVSGAHPCAHYDDLRRQLAVLEAPAASEPPGKCETVVVCLCLPYRETSLTFSIPFALFTQTRTSQR